jgi:hypothetical protein
VVVYPRLRCAYRESFNFQALPVEHSSTIPKPWPIFFARWTGVRVCRLSCRWCKTGSRSLSQQRSPHR